MATALGASMDNKGPVSVIPILLQGRKQIAITFKVHPDKVKEWVAEGAPVFQVGGMWQADYFDLKNWLLATRPAKNQLA